MSKPRRRAHRVDAPQKFHLCTRQSTIRYILLHTRIRRHLEGHERGVARQRAADHPARDA
ncbi:hypothetical protein BDV19DRAFT_358117 [Aspergillus venezuelensis]